MPSSIMTSEREYIPTTQSDDLKNNEKVNVSLHQVSTELSNSDYDSSTNNLTWLQKIVRFLEVKQEDSTNEKSRSIVETFLYNDDLRPVEKERRTWSWKQYVYFWVAGAFNVNTCLLYTSRCV